MLFDLRFLRQVLFGESGIALKTGAAEKRREQLKKMAEQLELEVRKKRAAEQDAMYRDED